MAMNITSLADRECGVLAAVVESAVIVAIVDALLEEFRDRGLGADIALVVLADPLLLHALVHTFLARLPEVGGAADVLALGEVALHRERIAVDEGHVAVAQARGGEVAFELGVAARSHVGDDLLRANEHCPTGGIGGWDTDLLDAFAELTMLFAPDAGVGKVPIWVFRGDVEAVLDGCCDISDLSNGDRGVAIVGDGWSGVCGVDGVGGGALGGAWFGLRKR